MYCVVLPYSTNTVPLFDVSQIDFMLELLCARCGNYILLTVAGLTRESSVAQSEFVKDDGFSSLLRAMQSDVEKLVIKSAFLMSALCQQQPQFTGL